MRYFKQSWQVIKQNKLFSSVYILGTALAIAMVMAYAIVWYIKIATVPPEVNRGRTLYLGYLAELDEKGGVCSSSMSHQFIETVFPENSMPQEVECVVEYLKSDDGEIRAYSPQVKEGIKSVVMWSTADILNVFEYKFLYGSGFTRADVDAGARKAFITRSYARKLFGTDDAVGKSLKLNVSEYIVCGVVKDVSRITSVAYANVWVPITSGKDYGISDFGDTQMLGDLKVIILARSSEYFGQIKEYVAARIKQINLSLQGVALNNYGQPDTHFFSIFRRYSNVVPNLGEYFIKAALVLLALLLVPAVNLAGIIASGMEGRLEELGIRKAFGASRGELLWQILCENFLLTLIGGALGLLLSYLIVWGASVWILQLLDFSHDFSIVSEGILITPGMLLNPVVFALAFLVCMMVNLLSATIPAALALRKDIIYSLTADKK